MKRKSIWIFAAMLALLVMGCDDNEPTDQVDGITLSPTECRIAPGEKVSFWVQTWPDIVDYTEIKWSSSNEAVATLDGYGWVVAVSEGKATITAKTYGKEATCEVTVCDHSWSDLKCTKCEIKMYIENGSINDEGVLTKYTGSEAEVVIPDGVTGIGSYAFKKDYGSNSWLTSVVIPDTVTSIGDGAFYECTSLASVTIPDSVTSIGESAFQKCTKLTSVTTGDGVTSIGSSAFDGCSKLTSVTIGENVTSIGEETFENCTSLASVTIPDSVTSIGEKVFYGCTKLTNVKMGDGVKSIGSHTFYSCTSLANVTIPTSVTSIGGSAFSGCTSLASVNIPASVTSIGFWAFDGCKSLDNVKYDGTEEQWKAIEKSSSCGLSGKTITGKDADGKETTWKSAQ